MRLQLYLILFFFGALGLIAYASRIPAPAPALAAPVVPRGQPKAVPPAAATKQVSTREPTNRVEDKGGYLDANLTWHLDSFLESTFYESGVDIRFIFSSEPLASIEDYARMRARAMGIGKAVDRRSVLFVYDVRNQQMRAEVGPGLEGILTDGFLGFLMREQTAAFFGAGDNNLALRSTLRIVLHRLREAALNEDYDPRRITWITEGQRLAAGAGATARVAEGRGNVSLRYPTLTGDKATYFGPQRTVALVFDRYLEALHTGALQPDLGLYTPPSEGVLRSSPLVPPFAQFITYAEYGQKYRIVERGDQAILFFTTTPFVSPHLFTHSAVGWQMDLAAEVRDTRENIGGEYTWNMRHTGDGFYTTFEDLFASYDGLMRPRDGDNRRLPLHGYVK
jgi:uncharacterized membrane protein YgcG